MTKTNLLSEKKIPSLPTKLTLAQKISLLASGKKANAILVGSFAVAIFTLAIAFLIVVSSNVFDHYFKEIKLVKTTGTVTQRHCDTHKADKTCERYSISFTYRDAENKQLNMNCYSWDEDTESKYIVGITYPVEYFSGYSTTAHLSGTGAWWADNNREAFGTLAAAVAFVWVCLFFVFWGIFKSNRHLLTVFTEWKLTIAEPKDKELFKAFTGTKMESMVRQFFTFWDETDTEHRASIDYQGFGNELVADEAWELVLYNPKQPTEFFLWDYEPGFPKINPNGELIFHKMWHIRLLFSICLLLTLLAALAFTSPLVSLF
jgi:hypothetical protein